MKSIPLTLSNGKRIGELSGDIAVLPVTSRNYLGLAHGYSLDAEVLRAIIAAGCAWIEFHHVKTKKVFRVAVDTFQAHAKPYNFGWGEKLVAPDSLYTVIAPASPGLSNLYA
jgi:hypothetical protein